MALSMSHHPRRSQPLRCVQHALSKAPPAPVCSGCSTSATEASVNAPATNRIISPTTTMPTVVRTPYSHVILPPEGSRARGHSGSLTSTQTFTGWKRPRGRPKTRLVDYIKHDIHYAGLDTTTFDRPQWKAVISGLRTLEPEQGFCLGKSTMCALAKIKI